MAKPDAHHAAQALSENSGRPRGMLYVIHEQTALRLPDTDGARLRRAKA